MQNQKPNVAIPLPKAKKNMVQFGCICLMLSIAMFGLSLATLQAPILEEMNAMSYFSLLTIFSSLGLSIMTPIGGKLGDLLGRRNIVIISGTICAICGIGMGFVRSLVPFMILRLLLGAAQGAFTAAPFILAREINEPKDVPKAMGLLSSAVAVGGFGGSIIAGILTDMGLLNVAIMFPAIPLLMGVILIGLNLPNKKREGNVNIDIPGIIALAITLTGILLALNYGPKIGWTQPGILAGFAVGIIALFVLVKVENKAAEPIIPMSLFKNKNYVTLLAVGFICYFYMTAMNTYAPLAVQKVLGQSTAVSGSLQMPRTIITILLPMAAGAWVGKKTQNTWKAMFVATSLVAVSFLVLGFTSTSTPVVLYFVALAITGIAESFRAVSITPAAQATLAPQDLGVGTSLVNFTNSLSGLIAAALFGLAYDINTSGNTESLTHITSGINTVFLMASLVSFIGLAIVLLVVRKQVNERAKESKKTA